LDCSTCTKQGKIRRKGRAEKRRNIIITLARSYVKITKGPPQKASVVLPTEGLAHTRAVCKSRKPQIGYHTDTSDSQI
jgi:hypothetical protein